MTSEAFLLNSSSTTLGREIKLSGTVENGWVVVKPFVILAFPFALSSAVYARGTGRTLASDADAGTRLACTLRKPFVAAASPVPSSVAVLVHVPAMRGAVEKDDVVLTGLSRNSGRPLGVVAFHFPFSSDVYARGIVRDTAKEVPASPGRMWKLFVAPGVG
jgi:hypothetical protein